jgi:tetratricopeptide (TPR) repeat protein
MGNGEEAATPRYTAFISYSHKDAAVGRWLHRRLEGYRLPRRLVGSEGERGPVPARLTPIFRDREELPAAGDLSERVRAALADSQALIVVCSPNAASSPWVAKEIETFRALHPDRPVLAAIAEGEPAECFAPALTAGGRVEPLAADFRPGRDGRRLGILKLVAGLSGVGLDALVQRDAQRRLRRVTYVTAAALAAVLIMAVLTAFAFRERREAEGQRADAEGMIEFMLTDLRDRLRAVGRLDAMEAVNARALAYYAKRPKDTASPSSNLRRARLLRAIGDDFITIGNLEKAEAALERARDISARERLRDPAAGEPRLENARSEAGLGRVDEERRDWRGAAYHYGLFARTALGLLGQFPKNADYLREAAWSAVDLGNVEMNGRGDRAGAEALYKRAVRWFAEASLIRPDDLDLRKDLANAHAWLADRYFASEQWGKAVAERVTQLDIMTDLSRRRPNDAELAFRYALAQRGLGRTYMKSGDLVSASRLGAEAYRSAVQLTLHDPRNAEWALLRGFVSCDLLFGKVDLPDNINAASLRRDVASVYKRLSESGDAKAAQLKKCAAALKN